MLQAGSATDATFLATMYRRIAAVAACDTPPSDFVALAEVLREHEKRLAERLAQAGPVNVPLVQPLRVRELSPKREELETAVFRAVLRLQSLRARADPRIQVPNAATAAAGFWADPGALSDRELMSLLGSIVKGIDALGGDAPYTHAKLTDVAARLAVMQELDEVARRSAPETTPVRGLIDDAMGWRLRMPAREVRGILRDLLAQGFAEPERPGTFRPDYKGACRLTDEGHIEKGRLHRVLTAHAETRGAATTGTESDGTGLGSSRTP